jgi:hypothetical protein
MNYTEDVSQIPWQKVVDICSERGPVIRYACPDHLWRAHLEGWRRARGNGHKMAPEPMPSGHCMFENPTFYACVHYGDTSEENKRKAIESHVRGMLSGWDKFLTDAMPEAEAKERFDAIVNASVEAKMQGIETGALPFVACVNESLGREKKAKVAA